jgi:hypothetical protein
MSDLHFKTIQVMFRGNSAGIGRAEGASAAWHRSCQDPSPMLGHCLPADNPPHSVCPSCGRRYQVHAGDDGKPYLIKEIPK